jgi:hypothetical protein
VIHDSLVYIILSGTFYNQQMSHRFTYSFVLNLLLYICKVKILHSVSMSLLPCSVALCASLKMRCRV